MNIYSKILITTLPLVFFLLLATVGTAYRFSRTALTELAETWLATRLEEAIQAAAAQENMLQRYGLESIPASIAKAKLDAGKAMTTIEVGEAGYIFAVESNGSIAVHPDAGMVGRDVSREIWFKTLDPLRTRLTYETSGSRHLAMVGYFEPWDWYVLASDTEREVYGVADRMRPYLIGFGIVGFTAMAAALMLLTRRLTEPLRLLTAGAERIGRGELDTRLGIGTRDEFGRLARVFNQMAQQLQKTLMVLQRSNQQLENRVAERTAALNQTNDQLRQEIEERERMSREKEKLLDQLFQAQKMKAIGTLAGGIAHDFNNLLMGIQGNVDVMTLDNTLQAEHHDRLNAIRDCVGSGARLTQQLLGFARLGKYEVKATDPNALIDKCADMFGRTRQELRIVTHFQNDVWAVNVDRGQIEQVLLNLFINAWQAMPDGGTIDLATTNATLDECQVAAYRVNPGNYVRISVSDTGSGMDEATLQRIFDPFFTTKSMQRGTGLGLASAYGIVRNHGGFIEVQSQPGQGSTFTIYLKALDKAVAGAAVKPENPPRGNETILLVDDDDLIIDVGQAMLRALGYEVLTADGGTAAISRYQDHIDRIDLVILDMIMPDLGGGRTYDKLKQINPDIKVLLASGYSINGQASEILERGCNGFIQKPFDLQALSRKVREVLEPAHDCKPQSSAM